MFKVQRSELTTAEGSRSHGCPLYDAGWAAESALPLSWASAFVPGVFDVDLEIPDQLPDEWEEE